MGLWGFHTHLQKKLQTPFKNLSGDSLHRGPRNPTITSAGDSACFAMNVSVGARVEIWWERDRCWYPGDIIAVNGVNAVVSYEDGALRHGPITQFVHWK